MPRRQAAGILSLALLAPMLPSGCGSEAAPPSTATNTPNYGQNKMPPAELVAPKKGQGARSTGAPPLAR